MANYRRIFRLAPRGDRDLRQQLDEEIESHIEMRTEELIRRGLSPEEARTEAGRRFGDLEEARRTLYESARRRGGRIRLTLWLDSLARDVVLAVRGARRSPGFTVLALAIFALGIGLTTATFSVVDHVLLRPLPFPKSDRLVGLESVDSVGRRISVVSSANWHDWRERNRTLAATALHSGWEQRFDVATGDGAFRVTGQLVVGPLFEVLGIRMRLGRSYTEEEARNGKPVAVVSEGFWRSVLGGSPRLDHELVINGKRHRIVGVVPAGLGHPRGTEVWMPAAYAYRKLGGAARNNVNWRAIARLRAGVELEQARADLGSIADAIRAEDPAGIYSYGVGVRPLREVVVGDVDDYLVPLMGAVALVLLIACANLAGISFARTMARAREIAVRLALGAGRRRVIQQLVIEYTLFALAGGALGVLLAWFATRLVAWAGLSDLPRIEEVAIDGRILAFAIAVSVLAGLLASLAPAVRASRTSVREAIGSIRGTIRGGRGLSGGALVGAEIALAIVLLTGSALLIRSFRSVLARDLGFEPEGVVAAEVSLWGGRYRAAPGRWLDYWSRALERARSIPGVGVAGLANSIPTTTASRGFIEVEGRETGSDGAGYRVVGGDYFRALAVPLLAGRTFDERDGPNAPRVVVINRSMAEMYWPGQEPIGRRVKAVSHEGYLTEGGAPWLTVVGVVGDIRHYGFESAPIPEMFVDYRQIPERTSTMHVVVRGDGTSAALASDLRRQLHDQDPTLAADLRLLEERLGAELQEQRLTMAVLTGFGLLALLLAGLGVYSLLSFTVARRTREIGIRAALGARRGGIVRLVLQDALRISLLGGLIGLIGALWLTKAMEALLVDVTRTDPLSYAVAAVTILAVAVLAGLIPARRAAKLDPLIALRAE